MHNLLYIYIVILCQKHWELRRVSIPDTKLVCILKTSIEILEESKITQLLCTCVFSVAQPINYFVLSQSDIL